MAADAKSLNQPPVRAQRVLSQRTLLERESLFRDLAIPATPHLPERALVPGFSVAPRVMFVDMNAFYASVEQQLRPELRGKPIIVVLDDSPSVIAASYEAKAFGIKNGMPIEEAMQRCPESILVPSRPRKYIERYERIVERLVLMFPRVVPYSIDEMACFLPSREWTKETLACLATQVKTDLAAHVGELVRCSIGVGPNVYLAKVASDLQKPDGFTVLDSAYPEVLCGLKLTDLPEIAEGIETRLAAKGINSVRDLLSCTRAELKEAWRSIEGAWFFEKVRGSIECDYEAPLVGTRRSFGSSRVIPDGYRSKEATGTLALVLTSKALMRLRAADLYAERADLALIGKRSLTESAVWRCSINLPVSCDDDLTWYRAIREAIADCNLPPGYTARFLSVRLSCLSSQPTNSLFAEHDRDLSALAHTVDAINARWRSSIHFGAMFFNHRAAPLRISFGPPHKVRA